MQSTIWTCALGLIYRFERVPVVLKEYWPQSLYAGRRTCAGGKQGDVEVTTLNSENFQNNASAITAGRIKPARAVVLVIAAAFALAGCESSTNILGGAQAPGPETSLAAPPSTSASTQTARLEIAPVIGAPENISRDLQNQLTSSMERNRITVARAPGGKGEYTLRGYIVAAREKTGSKISYIWDVTDQSGKRANRITGEVFAPGGGADPWAAVSPQVIQNIADKTAVQLASTLPGSSIPVASAASPISTAAVTPPASSYTTPAPGAVAAATPIAPVGQTTGSIDSGPVSTVVPAVTGAPGDGGATLTTAIQRELTKNGVALTSAPSGQTYKVEGKVAMGQGKDGKQPIQIDWNVIDPKGKKLGTVSQKNEVPQGSLDGAWGKTADAAAAAAAQGILKLLPQKATN